ncbi:MAG TPA: methyltransferase domain-containing protein [Solirubrobacteraceae bacterium]|nr:methyltransferase domain-containing protein [Solirubrobacteraceae bacterium]
MSSESPLAPHSPAQAWNQRYESTASLWSRSPNAALVRFASALVPGRALDLGAGEGRNSVWLATRGWQVTALDVSDVALARAAERAAAEGVPLGCVVADWREHELAPASLELVVVSFMHPDRHERPSMFERAARALVPGGHVFVTGVHEVDHGRRGPPDRDRLHTPERLREALQGFFEVLRCETVCYERERAGAREVVTDVVAIARRPAAGRSAPARVDQHQRVPTQRSPSSSASRGASVTPASRSNQPFFRRLA